MQVGAVEIDVSLGISAGVLIALLAMFWHTARWTSRVELSQQEVQSAITAVNKRIDQHMDVEDATITRLADSLGHLAEAQANLAQSVAYIAGRLHFEQPE